MVVWPARSAVKRPRFLVGAGAGGGEDVVEGRVGDHDHAVGVADDPVARVDVAPRPTVTGWPTEPTRSLVAPVQRDRQPRTPGTRARPSASTSRTTSVDDQAHDAAGLGRGGEHLTPVAELGLAADVDHQHRAGLGPDHADVDREVVARRAAHRDRRTRDLGPGPRGPDPVAHAPGAGLTQRRGAVGEQLGGRRGGFAHVSRSWPFGPGRSGPARQIEPVCRAQGLAHDPTLSTSGGGRGI